MQKPLPDSKIIAELSAKCSKKNSTSLNYLNVLIDFKKRVCDEVRYINNLFPEYTPHDGEYHLSRLFNIADDILGDELIKSLNSSELLVIALSLYGHDWGMAVSVAEREVISGNEQNSSSTYALLANETSDFQLFLSLNDQEEIKEISLEIWQEYVRNTHALRSGERIRDYFNSIDRGIGEAVARTSEGHWVEFKDLEDNDKYPSNYSVSGEIVNLKALSIYIRMIDLLDISQDRTPYVIWKFVAPQNARSKMEWNKHRAVHSVKCDTFQDGRFIQIDGSTDDHEVYAALMDLRNYCNDQLRGSNEILKQLNHSKYNLNIFDINWRISTRGFKPISVQFEFDRLRMFEVLSEEIYQGDKYVFLRELLQNSIDAIKLRREFLKKNDVNIDKSMGLINIEVIEEKDDTFSILFSDDGIGMDEHIVRNYLSVAGKSYYSSDDFKKLGIPIDPISKFGVGVLSCFMVADRVDITTFRDPYCSPGAEALKISIPSVYQQFRIETISVQDRRVGTGFKIYLSEQKLSDSKRGNAVTYLKITEYLKIIAGFVEFPIKISENGVTTVIIHPDDSIKDAKSRFGGCNIYQKQLSYPFELAFRGNSFKSAKNFFLEKTLDAKKDLKTKNVSGKITFLIPRDPMLTLTQAYNNWDFNEFNINQTGERYFDGKVLLQDEWETLYERPGNREGFGKSATIHEQYQIYLDGILISGATLPRRFDSVGNIIEKFGQFSVPYIVLNFDKNAIASIDLSRTEIVDRHNNWDEDIWDAYLGYIKKRYLKSQKNLAPKERLFSIAQTIFFHRIPSMDLYKIIGFEKWPIPIIRTSGKFDVIEAGELGDIVYYQPLFYSHFSKFIIENYQGYPKSTDRLDNWKNEDIILFEREEDSSTTGFSHQSKIILFLADRILSKKYELFKFRFLYPDKEEVPPLIQPIYKLRKINSKVTQAENYDILDKAYFKGEDLTFFDLNYLTEVISDSSDTDFRVEMPPIGEFNVPFDSCFSFGFKVLNYLHPNSKFLIKIISMGLLEEFNEEVFDELIDTVNELPHFNQNLMLNGFTFDDINDIFTRLVKLVKKNNLPIDYSQILNINHKSFVPESLYDEYSGDQKQYDFHAKVNTNGLDESATPYLLFDNPN